MKKRNKRIKRVLALGVTGLLWLAVISGCGKKETRDFSMEHHDWVFSNAVSREDGIVVACGEAEKEQYPEASVIELSCVASTNVLALGDENGKKIEISYRATGKDSNSLIYELVYQDGNTTVEGMAVSSITEYEKGKYEYTLVIDYDGYALYFYEREEETHS